MNKTNYSQVLKADYPVVYQIFYNAVQAELGKSQPVGISVADAAEVISIAMLYHLDNLLYCSIVYMPTLYPLSTISLKVYNSITGCGMKLLKGGKVSTDSEEEIHPIFILEKVLREQHASHKLSTFARNWIPSVLNDRLHPITIEYFKQLRELLMLNEDADIYTVDIDKITPDTTKYLARREFVTSQLPQTYNLKGQVLEYGIELAMETIRLVHTFWGGGKPNPDYVNNYSPSTAYIGNHRWGDSIEYFDDPRVELLPYDLKRNRILSAGIYNVEQLCEDFVASDSSTIRLPTGSKVVEMDKFNVGFRPGYEEVLTMDWTKMVTDLINEYMPNHGYDFNIIPGAGIEIFSTPSTKISK